ncbi:uncharacterized protein PRCAT00000181001 [Priceomyces carsonii]|uniref:uncharacterized protein n=1 Tax=Priceomyces carsonii TaxID=28549 RepID=UPI002EDBA04F|nr:unnamed protein product [Priceomyces carsonii]
MSNYDFNVLSSSLGSSKIKERNEALQSLEDYLSLSGKISSKPYRRLMNAVLDFVALELKTYRQNHTNQVFTRLTRASGLLRVLIEKHYEDRTILKFKTKLELVKFIIDNFKWDKKELHPCSNDFSKCLYVMLSQTDFQNHMNRNDWLMVYNFLVDTIGNLLDLKNACQNLTDVIIEEFFVCLQNLLYCKLNVSLSCMPFLIDRNYLVLLGLLQQTVKYCKRENLLTIVVFRMINKLIVVISTEDTAFVTKLTKVGIELVIQFYQSQLESMQTQILDFLNLSTTIKFSSIVYLESKSRHLYGDTNSLDSHNSIKGSSQAYELGALLYSFQVLINCLMTRLLSPLVKFKVEDIGLIRSKETNMTWFRLRALYLRSDNIHLWLYFLGLLKLILTYFNIRECVEFFHEGISEQPNKRAKLDGFDNYLKESQNTFEFCIRLMEFKSSEVYQRAGLQLLIFYVEAELDSCINNGDERNKQIVDHLPDLVNSCAKEFRSFNYKWISLKYESIFDHILNLNENKSLAPWVLLLSRSLMLDSSNVATQDSSLYFSTKFNQLLNVSLQGVKDSELFRISCDLVNLILMQYKTKNKGYLDNNIRMQLENLIEFSEINGPYSICEESFLFWYAVYDIVESNRFRSKSVFVYKVQEWMISKWDESFQSFDFCLLESNSGFPSFFSWLFGAHRSDIRESSFNTSFLKFHGSDCNEYCYLQKRYLKLQMFTSLRRLPHEPGSEMSQEKVDLSSSDPIDRLLLKLLGNLSLYSNSKYSSSVRLEWTILVLGLISLLRRKRSFNNIINSLEYQCQNTLRDYGNVYIPNEVVLDLLKVFYGFASFALDDKAIQILVANFPLKKYVEMLPSLLNATENIFEDDSLTVEEETGASLDKEFEVIQHSKKSEIGSTSMLLTAAKLNYVSVPSIDLLKFLIETENLKKSNVSDLFSSLLMFLEELKSVDAIYCYYHLHRYFVEMKINLSEVPAALLIKFIRILGEGPLIDEILDRAELTVVVVSRILSVLLPVCYDLNDDSLIKDSLDVCGWLVECATKNFLLTELSFTEYCIFLLRYLRLDNQAKVNGRSLRNLFLEGFATMTNNMKVTLAEEIAEVFRVSCLEFQIELFKDLLARLPEPNESREKCSTYVQFLCILSKSSSYIFVAVLLNIIEWSKSSICLPYLRLALNVLSRLGNFSNVSELFENFQLQILKHWWLYNDFGSFPFFFFGYNELSKFLLDNSTFLAAITISSDKAVDKVSVLNELANAKDTDVESLVYGSLPLTIALSYTKKGVRNGVFVWLAEFFKSDYKANLTRKLTLVMMEVIKYINVSDEKTLQSQFTNTLCLDLVSHNKSSLLPTFSESSISPESGLSLLNSLIKKFRHNQPGWSEREVYFLLRKIISPMKRRSEPHEMILILRRVKLILILGTRKTLSYDVSRLLLNSLCVFLKEVSLQSDILQIFTFLDIQNLGKFGELESLPLFIKLLSSVMEVGLRFDENFKIFSSFSGYLQQYHVGSKVHPILLAGCCILKEERPIIRSSMVENLLDDSQQIKMCEVNGDLSDVLVLISQVFEKIDIYDEDGSRDTVVEILLNAKINLDNDGKVSFKLWSANYLSLYYLNGGLKLGLNHVYHLREFWNPWVNSLETLCGRLDMLLDYMVEFLASSSPEIVSSVENILGVLIWKYEQSTEEVLAVINFEEYYRKYSKFILPMDFEAYTSLNLNKRGSVVSKKMSDFLVAPVNFLDSSSYYSWISEFFLAINQEIASFTSISVLFSDFAIKEPSFAKNSLPFLICYYIQLTQPTRLNLISELLKHFFKFYSQSEEFSDLLINIILAIRVGARKKIKKYALIYQNVLVEDLILIASSVRLFKTAILFLEDMQHGRDNIECSIDLNRFSYIFESIDDEDYVYGLPEKTTIDYAISVIEREGHTSDVLKLTSGMLDANTTLNFNYDRSNVLPSLMNSGMMTISRIVSDLDSSTEVASYEWAWKLGCWDLPIPEKAGQYHETVYKTLRQIHDYPIASPSTCLNALLDVFLNKEVHVCKKSTKEMDRSLIQWFKTMATITSIEDALKNTSSNFSFGLGEYSAKTAWFDRADSKTREDILLARNSTFQLLGNLWLNEESFRESDKAWMCSLHELIRYNNYARLSKQPQKMINSTILMNEIAKSKFHHAGVAFEKSVDYMTNYQAACTLWELGQTGIPTAMLKKLSSSNVHSPLIDELYLSKGLINATLAGWMADSRQELASDIMDQYVLPSAREISEVKDCFQRAKVYQLFARFCESQHKSRVLTDEQAKIEKRIASKTKEIAEFKDHYGKTSVDQKEKKTAQKYYGKLKALLVAELKNLETLLESRNEFSKKCIEYYLKCISIDENNDEDTDKFIALWLEQSSRDDINMTIKEDIFSLPTYKLIDWCTQLTSRLSNDKSEFQLLLQELLLNLCLDHPFHSLYSVISLRNYGMQEGGSSKYAAADSLLDKLSNKGNRSVDAALGQIIRLCHESIKLAELKVSRGRPISLDKYEFGGYWLNELPSIPPPTMNIPIDKSKAYNNVPYFLTMENRILIASSGLSLPKIATFVLSNGTEHRVLFKHGTDDLRQDSIMEQVFEKVNKIFIKDRQTRRRKLRIRTYKAVPLSPLAGIIEYVPNSMALLDVIKPYHLQRDGMKLERAREIMKEHQSKDKTDRLTAYYKITSKIGPVLRCFFFDNFITPDIWFESKLTYTRGIAATSLVGHILGLGDRHCNNILLDKKSGEPIHIDLGVAFDQGKKLPIPESVPFRLTRDIVDGFGITGVNGVFIRSCEHTFRVLRGNKDHILAILDVLRWDPLYSWTLSPIRQEKLQHDAAEVPITKIEEDGSEAGRALSTVSDKLIAGGLSIEATVRELVQEASSPQNLALIYFGWCPFY